MSKNGKWFEVDQRGLAKLMARRGKAVAVLELIQNAFDEPITSCRVSFEVVESGLTLIAVEDDAPDGWRNLQDAFTLFAESKKKADPNKRGRFNLGEKLLIACCKQVEISSTVGGLRFDEHGRHGLRAQRTFGTRVTCWIKLTKAERAELDALLAAVIAPPAITYTVNGTRHVEPTVYSFDSEELQTEIADAEGFMSRTARQTEVRFYEARQGKAHLYELGIPVCEIEGPMHVNVLQKVPLTMDRESVRPGYLKRINEIALKHCHHLITPEELRKPWAEAAAEASDAPAAAVEAVLAAKFGEKRVSFDMSDAEANALAITSGYNVVHGGSMSGALWTNAKAHGAIRPAGEVTPSPKPYSEHGKPLRLCTVVTPGMQFVEDYAKRVAALVLNCNIQVQFAAEVTWPYAATYGPGCLTFNVGKLGKAWFDLALNRRRIEDLLIHEFGHHYESNHLSESYYKALTSIAAHMLELTRQHKL